MQTITTSPLLKHYTLEEFWALPDPSDRSRLELIAGVLYMTPPPEHTHDLIVNRILRLLVSHIVEMKDRGRILVPRAALWTGTNTYLEPDLFYISEELEGRLDLEHRDTADLVVEVVSPGSAVYDRNTKADTYGAIGVKELWLVYEKTQEVEVRLQTGSGFAAGTLFGKGQKLISMVFSSLDVLVDPFFDD